MKVPHWARNFLKNKIDLSTFSLSAVKEFLQDDLTILTIIRPSSLEEWCAIIDVIVEATGCTTPSERFSAYTRKSWEYHNYLTYDPQNNMLFAFGSGIYGFKTYSYEEFEDACSIKYQNLELSVDCLL